MSENKLILRATLEEAFKRDWGGIMQGIGTNGETKPDMQTVATRIATTVIGSLCEMKTGNRLVRNKNNQFSWEESERTIQSALICENKIENQIIETLEFYAKLKLTHGTDIGFQARESLKIIKGQK